MKIILFILLLVGVSSGQWGWGTSHYNLSDAIAYYDTHYHMGYSAGLNTDTIVVMTGADYMDLDFWNGLYIYDGTMELLSYYPPPSTSDNVLQQSSGTHWYRRVHNGVVYLNHGAFDRSLAEMDTVNLMNSVSDTVYLREKSAYGSDRYDWNISNPNQPILNFYNTNTASNLWIDQSQYSFDDGAYYQIEFEYKNGDTASVGTDIWLRRSDSDVANDYNSYAYSSTDKSWHLHRTLYKHANGTYWLMRLYAANATTQIRNLKVGKILNPSECIFSWGWFKSHIRDKFDNYDALILDTTRITSLTNMQHMRPLQGLQLAMYEQMKYTATTLNGQVDNGNDVDLTLNVASASTNYSIGDTVRFEALNPVEFNGYKILTNVTSTTITYNQKTFNTCTDGAGYISRYENNSNVTFTYPNNLAENAKTVLAVRGSTYRSASERYDVPWSYSEAFESGNSNFTSDSASQVLLWFEWYDSLNQIKLNDKYIMNPSRLFGIVVFDDVLSSYDKYNVCTEILAEYELIYQQVRAPQVEWLLFDKYWVSEARMFNNASDSTQFRSYERMPRIEVIGQDSLFLVTANAAKFGFNNGWQGNWEYDNQRACYWRLSTDAGLTWSTPHKFYQGTQFVKHAGDTVMCLATDVKLLNDDSVCVAISQADSITSPSRSLIGQKAIFAKAHKSNLYNWKVRDETISSNYHTVGFGDMFYGGDSIYFPAYDAGYIQLLLRSGNNFKTWARDSIYTGTDTTGNESYIVPKDTSWYGFRRTQETGTGSSFYTDKSVDRNTFTKITPLGKPARAGISAPVCAGLFPNDDVVMIYNIDYDGGVSDRETFWFARSIDNVNSIQDTTPLFDAPNGIANKPNYTPWALGSANFCYSDFCTDGSKVYLVTENGSNEFSYSYFFKFENRYDRTSGVSFLTYPDTTAPDINALGISVDSLGSDSAIVTYYYPADADSIFIAVYATETTPTKNGGTVANLSVKNTGQHEWKFEHDGPGNYYLYGSMVDEYLNYSSWASNPFTVPFPPYDVMDGNVTYIWRSDTLVSLVGSKVSEWGEAIVSQNFAQTTDANRPYFNSDTGSLRFDYTSSQYMSAGTTLEMDTANFTIDIVMERSNYDTLYSILVERQTSSNNWKFGGTAIGAGQLIFQAFKSGVELHNTSISAGSFPTDRLTVSLSVIAGTSHTWYVNGNLITSTSPYNVLSNFNNTGTFYLSYFNGTQYYNGDLWLIRISNVARTQFEHIQLYNWVEDNL